MGKRLLSVIVVGLLLTGVGAGCPAKKKKGAEGEAGPGAGAGVGEEGLGAGGSLDRYKSGTLGAGAEQGPLQDVPFPFDSYELDDAARSTLQENANWLKDHPKAKAEVEGHTAPAGPRVQHGPGRLLREHPGLLRRAGGAREGQAEQHPLRHPVDRHRGR